MNQQTHTNDTFMAEVLKQSVFSIYHVPETNDLNTLFSDAPETDFLEIDLESNDLTLENLSPPPFINAPSKNVAEKGLIMEDLVCAMPLTNIFLARLTRSRFLGIISFPEDMEKLHLRTSRHNAIVTDEKQEVTACSSRLAQTLGLKDPRELLGCGLSQVLRLDADPFPLPLLEPRLHAARKYEWRAGSGDPSQVFENGPRAASGKEIIWDNSRGSAYSYLFLNPRCNPDREDFEFELEFRTDRETVPAIVWRGLSSFPGATPDTQGYALVTAGRGRLGLKRKGFFQHFFYFPAELSSRGHTLTLRKKGIRYSVFFDGAALGSFDETHPHTSSSEDRICLFLRHSESAVLNRAAFRQAPSPRSGRQDAGLRAESVIGPRRLQFNVTAEQSVVSTYNAVYYFLEDVTEFSRRIRQLREQRDRLATLIPGERDFLGQSAAVNTIREQIPALARSNLSIIIEGETGTGKEVLARAIHRSSARRTAPFIKVDCATLPQSLMESELFGHEKGAFTGAASAYAGRFEQAQGGTLFLDEIANLPPAVQVKLLQVLQDRRIQRLGGTASISLDIRIIAASNAPLKALMSGGLFREDLYYRLNQCMLRLPPLRERREDIPLLAAFFLEEANTQLEKQVTGFSAGALEKMTAAPLNGNVRELRNIVFQAVLFARGGEIGPADIQFEEVTAAPAAGPSERPARKKRRKWQKAHIEDALRQAGGNVAQAARMLAVSRMMAYNLLRKFRIRPGSFSPPQE
jgi:DNA-binding NtrC family response regulator